MKRKILLLACFSLLLLGCKKEPELGAPMSMRILGVSGSTAGITELTMGLFAGAPIYADNVPLKVGGNARVSFDEEVRWAFDQKKSTSFVVYAPYDKSFSGQEVVTFDVPCDQSTADRYRSANYLTGVVTGNPDQSSVDMKLNHAMTAMIIGFDNRTNDPMVSMTVSGFSTRAMFNTMTGIMKADDGKERIIPMRSPAGDDVFAFLYVPQPVTPVFHVTLASGKTLDITFDNGCNEYPGKVITIGLIPITEYMQDANILPLSGVSISQWATSGLPAFPTTLSYNDLTSLAGVECDSTRHNFFETNIRKVTVTHIDKTNANAWSVILEDSTRAVHAILHNKQNVDLNEGSTIVGRIYGCLEKQSDGGYFINNLGLDMAEIHDSWKLPCTEGTFSDVLSNIGKMEYRRMLFKDVVLVESFEKGHAVFMQDGVTVSVVCPDLETDMVPGVSGDLVAFPIRVGTEIELMAYDSGQFYDFWKSPEESYLTTQNLCGIYDLESNGALYVADTVSCQLSIRYLTDDETMQITCAELGTCAFITMNDAQYPITGHEYEFDFTMLGLPGLPDGTLMMECVDCRDEKAWFVDESGRFGLIFAL